MINVVQEIVDKLRTVYPSAQYDIYTERIEQGFSAPCFAFGSFRAADVTPYRPGLHEIVQHMDVRFFRRTARPRGAVPRTTQALTLLLRRTESLRGSNLSWEITDGAAFLRRLPAVRSKDIPETWRNLQTTIGTEGNEMAVKRKTEAGAPAFYRRTALTFDRYRERRDLLGVCCSTRIYTFSEVDALVSFMKGKGELNGF